MNNEIKNYIVSSAGWELTVDHTDHESAATSALIMAMSIFGDNLKVSTVMMVDVVNSDGNTNTSLTEFVPTYLAFKRMGALAISKDLKEITISTN
jgi:hypothetical protein